MFDAGPFAKVWAPNLTELAARTSDQQLAAAIRQGIGHDGRALFDHALAHVLAALRRGGRRPDRPYPRRAARRRARRRHRWGPIGRFALAKGDVEFATDRIGDFRDRPPLDTGPATAAGRRLAATICSECHGPGLSGGQPTPDVSAPDLSLAGAYDLAQFTRLMRTGRPPDGRDLGLMREVSELDLSQLTDAEIGQLHAYLQARAQRVEQ